MVLTHHAKLFLMNTFIFEVLDHIPSPSPKRIAVHVSKGAERAVRAGHPWIYDQAIHELSHTGQPGDLAVLFDSKRKFIAIGLYDPFSPIRIRILQHRKPATINQSFFTSRLKSASNIRKSLFSNTTGYRLVHGENDRFPGLVIDQYDSTLVAKLYTTSWLPHLRSVISSLLQIHPCNSIVLRFSRDVQKQDSFLYGLQNGNTIYGKAVDSPVRFTENGLCFEADPIRGHKTGFYLDQRDNRLRVQKLASNKSVLNLFAYTGGFSVYAAQGGATNVTSIDISKQALEVAERNFFNNSNNPLVNKCRHTTIAGDAFGILDQFSKDNRIFDLIVIDPPSFAKSRKDVVKAVNAYQRLTQMALSILKPSGDLVQASCSSQVSAEIFFSAINQAAAEYGRPLIEYARTGHPIDHPTTFKEGAYLKCLYAKG